MASLQETTSFVSATPVLPSLDIARTVSFFCGKLGFDEIHAAPGEYAIVERGPVELHFWRTDAAGIVHPNAPLVAKPWGTREFAILDPDGNCLTFHQSENAA